MQMLASLQQDKEDQVLPNSIMSLSKKKANAQGQHKHQSTPPFRRCLYCSEAADTPVKAGHRVIDKGNRL